MRRNEKTTGTMCIDDGLTARIITSQLRFARTSSKTGYVLVKLFYSITLTPQNQLRRRKK